MELQREQDDRVPERSPPGTYHVVVPTEPLGRDGPYQPVLRRDMGTPIDFPDPPRLSRGGTDAQKNDNGVMVL
ncbi:MAG: hypothetical protein H6597_01125 [Flavobacteriales bacterium]|nr:hypothetical protein [Flavobacteriales bacterium]